MVVHSILPEALTLAADAILRDGGIRHVAHGDDDPVGAAGSVAADPDALALLGPFRSAHVAEALDATAPAHLPLLAPMATWSGVTRADEPTGSDDTPQPRGTVFRLLARDTEVARRLALDARAAGRRALVIAGDHEYGVQLDEQLHLSGLPRADDAQDADFLLLCGLVGEREIARAAAVENLPIVAFDGVQGADLGGSRPVDLALPFAPDGDADFDHFTFGQARARHAAELVCSAVQAGAQDRAAVLAAVRALGNFDEHGDLRDPPVWLWRADAGDWITRPQRPLPGSA